MGSTTTETPNVCEDDKAVCCGNVVMSSCDAEEKCEADWTYMSQTVCEGDVYACPDGAPVTELEYTAENCCDVSPSDCCVRKCDDGSIMQGTIATDGDGDGAVEYCSFEYEECGACPTDDALTCSDGDTIERDDNCEFDLSDCCDDRDGCIAIGYETDEGIACKYECDDATTKEPMDGTSTTDDGTGGPFSGGMMMDVMVGIVFVCGIFGWM